MLMGSLDGHLTQGIYKGSIQGDSTWSLAESTEFAKKYAKQLKGSPVSLTVIFPDRRNESIAGTVKVLDILIDEYHANQFTNTLPSDFVLIAMRVGIVEK